MDRQEIAAFEHLLETPKKSVIVPHRNPDGDAIGSCLALWHYLRNRGQEATVIVPNDYPKFLKWMSGNESVLNFERDHREAMARLNEADFIYTLDFNHLGRTGQMEEVLQNSAATFIMVDHHQEPSDYATITYSDATMSSTCEMVYHLLEFLGDTDRITSEMADCLYAGIMTDTGSFKFAATTSKTHRVVADLIDKGAQNTTIHHRIFDTNSPQRLRLLGIALKNLVILEEYGTAYITLSQAELDGHAFQKGDTEGFVNYGLTLEGICFAAIFIENREEGIIKISFRSVGDFSVNEFARKHFEGGGHINAAGGRSTLDMEGTTARFETLLADYKKELVP